MSRLLWSWLGLTKVNSRGCLLVLKAVLVNSPPPRAVSIGGKVGAGNVDSQVLSLAGLEVIQWQAPSGSQFIPSGLVGVGPHIGVIYISEDIGSILMLEVTLEMDPGPARGWSTALVARFSTLSLSSRVPGGRSGGSFSSGFSGLLSSRSFWSSGASVIILSGSIEIHVTFMAWL